MLTNKELIPANFRHNNCKTNKLKAPNSKKILPGRKKYRTQKKIHN